MFLSQSSRNLLVSLIPASLEKEFGSRLSEVKLSIHHKEFGSEKPEKDYNVYVEWDIETLYRSGDDDDDDDDTAAVASVVTADRRREQDGAAADGAGDAATTVPSPEKLNQVLVQGTDLMDYMLKAVQPIRRTAFANVTMSFMGAKLANKTTF